jgi:hypothetical protein
VTLYYVRPDGNDANPGTGPAAGSAWRTWAKVLGAASTVVGGDTVYFAPGVYRELVTVALPSPASEVRLVGDYHAARFTDLRPGDVTLTAWTTSDTTAALTSAIPLSCTTAKSWLTFEGLVFVGQAGYTGGAAVDVATTGVPDHWTFRRCVFLLNGRQAGSVSAVRFQVATPGPLDLLIERCIVFNPVDLGIDVRLAQSATAAYDPRVTIRHCAIYAYGSAIRQGNVGGTVTYGPTGFRVYGCTFGGNTALEATSACNVSRSRPVLLWGCLVAGDRGSFIAGGELVEELNALYCVVRSSGESSSGLGLTSRWARGAPRFEFGQSALWGRTARPFLAPSGPGAATDLWNGEQLVSGAPAVCADDASVGTVAWTSPANAVIEERSATLGAAGAATLTALPVATVAHYLKWTGFGLTIPSDATITGIRVRIVVNSTTAVARSYSVRLVKSGAIVGDDLIAQTNPTIPTGAGNNWGQLSYGGARSLWGQTWTPAEVNATDFGFVWSCWGPTSSPPPNVMVDTAGIVVAYLPATPDDGGDLLGVPRPSGLGTTSWACGAYERGDTLVKETTVFRTASPSGKLVGPGVQDLQVPVAAAGPKTVRVWARYDGAYAGPLPTLAVLPDEALGLSTATTATMAGAANAWEQLSVTVSPSKAGVLRVRLRNRATAAAGVAYFDDLAP